jgi:hypothetical protein
MPRFRLVLRLALICFEATVLCGCGSLLAAAQNSCQFNSAQGKIQHVIYIQFDNTHLRRDNPNVPSDLEQMPHLLNFIRSNGALDPNHHTVLISHTANGILTSLTGVYSDRHGIPVANSYVIFRPDGTTAFPSSFFYWTDLVSDVVGASSGDNTFGMLTADGKNAPAPWVPFTRAGCDVGAYSTANIVIERTPFDVAKVFGAGSPEAAESSGSQFTDFAGIAVHCAQNSSICGNPNTKAVADTLPQEPGGYTGYSALFGAKYVNKVVQLRDLDNNPITGFAGFSPSASETLGAIATMQEAGIPVTISYIADAHDDRVNGVAFGPGQAGYVAQLKAYDEAFAKFFARLKADGMDQHNTLFVFTADEGDHFAGGPPTPANCDGINVPCSYTQIGELDVNLNGLVATQAGNSTPFSIHFDMAPTISIIGNPSPTSSTTRQLERDITTLTAVNPITNQTDKLTTALADPVEMGLLHMITHDPARTPSFTMFGDPDYFFLSFGSPNPVEEAGFAWNHGGIQTEIAQTWLGLVGPGVLHGHMRTEDDAGIEFSDHTDIRPTIMTLLGLQDDYVHDGRVLFEVLNPSALPQSLRAHSETLLQLARVYKQVNAPFGQLGRNSLAVSTAALASNSNNDEVYTGLESKIAGWRERRDSIAGQMRALLEGAAFGGQRIGEQQAKRLINQGQALLEEVTSCAADLSDCQE